jgi:N-acylneuraminate cytidylyltransferase
MEIQNDVKQIKINKLLYKMKTITAVIPVREGSRRLKNKNIAPFAGTNLLINKINQLKQVTEITKIVVSSDSETMLAMAKVNGVDIHKRAIEFCDEKTKTFGEVVRHIADSVDGETILWATCTSPLVFPKDYSQAIKEYYNALDCGFDSLMCVENFKRYIWSETGPLNYELGLKHVPSQQLPSLYFVTDGILIAPREKMIEWAYFHGQNPYKFIVNKRTGCDIDDGLDLACARAWLDMDESVSQIDPYIE